MNFRTFLFSSACALALGASHAHAGPSAITEFDSVDAFRTWAGTASSGDLHALTSFHLAAYYCATPTGYTGAQCPADGGEGLFVQKNDISACGAGSEDGGSILVEARGTIIAPENYCFKRQNVNGDIRQFGVTKGSDYDCAPVASGGKSVGACTAITATGTGHPDSPWDALVTAASKAGVPRLTFAGLQILADADLTIPVGTELDLGGASPFATAEGLLDIPGSVFLTPGHSVKMQDQSAIHNGLILPNWYDGVKDSIEDLYAYRQTMIDNGDTGLICDTASGCIVRDMAVDGFDTAVQVRHAPYSVLDNVSADGNVCYWASATGGNVRWNTLSCNSATTRSSAELQFFKIDAIAEETTVGAHSGTCKVTLHDDPTTHIQEGFVIWGRGATTATGGTNINNRYHVHLTGTAGVIDLDGSSCHGANLDEESSGMTANWTAGDRKLHVLSVAHVQAGDTIAGTGTALDGLHVAGVWPSKNIIVLDAAPSVSGTSSSLIARGGAYNNAVAPCVVTGSDPAGVCLALDASARVEANATVTGSLGGQKAGGVGTGFLIGGPTPKGGEDPDDDLIAGFHMALAHTFGRTYAYHIENANETQLTSVSEDESGTYVDTGRIFLFVNGDSNDASVVNGSGAKSGTGIYVDLHSDGQCLNFVAGNDSARNTTNALFDIENGCFIAEGMRPDGGNGFIANTASNVSFVGSYIPAVNIFYEDATARAHTSTTGASVGLGENNRMDGVTRVESGSLGVGVDPAAEIVSPLELLATGTATTISANLTNSQLGTLDVGSTTGFPATGVMLITNEALAYTVVDSNTINITARGLWGTGNAVHTSGDQASYFTLIDGHADSALPAFAVTSLGNIWWSGHTTTTGTVPTVTGSAAGTGATIAGNDNAGRVAIGTSPTGTTVTVNFAQNWTSVPVCFAMDETTLAVNPIFLGNETKALVQFKTATTPTVGDKISYSCTGFK